MPLHTVWSGPALTKGHKSSGPGPGGMGGSGRQTSALLVGVPKLRKASQEPAMSVSGSAKTKDVAQSRQIKVSRCLFMSMI